MITSDSTNVPLGKSGLPIVVENNLSPASGFWDQELEPEIWQTEAGVSWETE